MAKNFLVLTVLIWQILSCNLAFASGNGTSHGAKSFACDLPAPTNFHVVNIGTTYVDLAWNSVPGATGYLLQTFDSYGNLVDTLHPVGPSATVTGLQPGTSYTSILYSKCEGGLPGFGAAIGAHVDYITLIVDLILQASGPGMTMLEYPPVCSLLPWDDSVDSYWFEVKEIATNKSSLYQVNRVAEGHIKNRGPVLGGTLPTQQFDHAGYTPPFSNINTRYVDIKVFEGPFLYRVRFVEDPTSAEPKIKICKDDQESTGYSFRLIALSPPEAPPRNDVPFNPDATQDNETPVWIQNPFAETINIVVPQISKEPVNIQLFDLNGNLVSAQQFEAGQEQYALPTEYLPAGFYFLRMETAGKVKTFKVVKSE